MNTLLWVVLAIAVLLAVWQIWGMLSSRVEQLSYTVLEKKNGYEIRQYAAHIAAQTEVRGEYNAALNQGFRIVAGYIFGGNEKKESIAMTAPVVEAPGGEQIAMTAPVTADIEGDIHTISFSMPSSYTLATLPKPADPRVKIVEVPERKMAARTFSWYATPARIQSQKKALFAALSRDGVRANGSASYAGYNAPWTPPWLMRNEILIQIF